MTYCLLDSVTAAYANNISQISALVNELLQENDVIRDYLFINAE